MPDIMELKARHHFNALDGLRGVAIILVMFAHFVTATGMPDSVSNLFSLGGLGVTGVDLFFVLSGFLITDILLKSKGRTGYYSSFLRNRAVRIFPLYYLLIFGLLALKFLIVAWPSKFGFVAGMTKGDIWIGWFLAFLVNVKMVIESAWGSPGHLWTLSVEQQFYLFWPAVVAVTNEKRFRAICWILILSAFLLRVAVCASSNFPDSHTVYFICHTLTPCRMDCFAVGALIALNRQSDSSRSICSNWLKPAMILIAACLLAANIFEIKPLHVSFNSAEWSNADWVLPVFIYTFWAFFYGIIIEGLVSGKIAGNLMNHRILRLFGKYSYAMYLFHPFVRHIFVALTPVAKIQSIVHSPIIASCLFVSICVISSYLIGWISWVSFEKHWLKLKANKTT